jgi:hypothetical protein
MAIVRFRSLADFHDLASIYGTSMQMPLGGCYSPLSPAR